MIGKPTAQERERARAAVRQHESSVLNWKKIWDEVPRETDWMVESFIERGTISMLYGKSDAGKSLLTLFWCARLAASGLTVVWFDFEDRPKDFVTRLEDMGYGPEDLYTDSGSLKLAIFSNPTIDPLDTEKGGRTVLDMATAYSPDLVVINSLSRIISGKENDADTYLQLYRCTAIPLRERGITIHAIDHEGKDQAKGQRGSSAKANFADAVWHMAKSTTANNRVLTRERGRQRAEDSGKIYMSIALRPLTFARFDPAGPSATDRLEAAARALTVRINELQIPRDWGRRKIKEALSEAGVATPRAEVLAEACRLRKAVPGTGREPVGTAEPVSAGRFPVGGLLETAGNRRNRPDSGENEAVPAQNRPSRVLASAEELFDPPVIPSQPPVEATPSATKTGLPSGNGSRPGPLTVAEMKAMAAEPREDSREPETVPPPPSDPPTGE